MMSILLFLILTLLPLQAFAGATINVGPSDCSASTVQTAITNASSGDVINLTCTGTVNWSAGVEITHGKTLKGPGLKTNGGADKTGSWPLTITASFSGDWVVHIANVPEEQLNRVTGLKFAPGTGTPKNIIVADGWGAGVSPYVGAFRIDNNYIAEAPYSTNGGRVIITETTGLVDHNVFEYKSTSYNPFGNFMYEESPRGTSPTCYGYASWARATGFGTNDFMFLEDNYLLNTGIETSGGGGRLVARHNTFETDYSVPLTAIDGHGFGDGGQYSLGVVAVEVYQNNMVGALWDKFVSMKGGTWRVHNNTVASGTMQIMEYRLRTGGVDWQSCGTPGSCYCSLLSPGCTIQTPTISDFAACYPIPYALHDTMVWNNISGGSNMTPAIPDDAFTTVTAYYLALNRDYFMPSYGTTASKPATCSTGNYYGETDGLMRMYSCTAPNWVLAYTPYQYPHPLNTGNTPATSTGGMSGAILKGGKVAF